MSSLSLCHVAWLSRFDRFSHLSYDLEGDAGNWAVLEHRGDGEYLLLYGEWSWHANWFSAENYRLTAAEAAIVTRVRSAG